MNSQYPQTPRLWKACKAYGRRKAVPEQNNDITAKTWARQQATTPLEQLQAKLAKQRTGVKYSVEPTCVTVFEEFEQLQNSLSDTGPKEDLEAAERQLI